MVKERNEIRDPVHVFVTADPDEIAVVDSRPFQRLRNIHQLSLSYLIYPGATHKRFEHCLGVMHLAGFIYDTVVRDENLSDPLRQIVPSSARKREYWRSVVRMAALCHDLGHLPFSHGVEGLLPGNTTHEQISRRLIECDEMAEIWDRMKPSPSVEDIVKVALGPEEASGLQFDTWEAVLSDMITSDVFGADRIDYLLRDSLHAGVAYGRFDYHRLVQSMRILPDVRDPKVEGPITAEEAQRSTLGVVRGGLESAEAALVARYFMYSQVYLHDTRLIFDIHLRDFMVAWLKDRGGVFPTEPEEFLEISDAEVLAAMAKAVRDSDDPGHEPAWRIANREHFRVCSNALPTMSWRSDAAKAIYKAVRKEFGKDIVRFGHSKKAPGETEFPVRDRNGRRSRR